MYSVFTKAHGVVNGHRLSNFCGLAFLYGLTLVHGVAYVCRLSYIYDVMVYVVGWLSGIDLSGPMGGLLLWNYL